MTSPSSSANSKPRSSRAIKPPRRLLQLHEWLWPGLWVALLVSSGAFCLWSVLWLTRIPPLPECDRISRLNSNRDRIYCAKTQTRSGSPQDLTSAIGLTADWPQTHTDYEEAQALLKEASEKLLVLANREAQAGRLPAAVDLASAIPLGTPLRQPAQAVIYEWRQEWQQGRQIETELQTAIHELNWDAATAKLQQFKSLRSDYWLDTRYHYWWRQLQMDRQGWTQLMEARQIALSGETADLQAAIAMAQSIPLASQVWADAEPDISRWSRSLLAIGLQQWQAGDLNAALATVQVVPPLVGLDPDLKALMEFSQAQKLADRAKAEAPSFKPTYANLFYLMEGIRALEHLPPMSPFYEQAQQYQQTWQAELADLVRLQFANSLAGLGQEATYHLAIDHAATVEIDRPRRIQAQTLIADWRNQIQRIEDRPILRRADSLARTGTIPALQAAIAEASKVELGRALRIDAQSRIANWTQEIQVIEDRPIMDEAVALADQKQLKEAIAVAQRIQPNRALYDRAQLLIQDWTREIQIAEDQPILDEAKDLAWEGKLSAAITLASQIAPGRALYGQAQQAIRLWKAEREYIWSIRAAENAAQDTSESSADESE